MKPTFENQYTEQRHSEEIDDIIKSPPNWLMRFGAVSFLTVLSLMIVVSYFLRYPDIVKTKLKIVSENAPKSVTAKVGGRLEKLLVAENEVVRQGQPLAYLESTGRHQHVQELFLLLEELKLKAQHNSIPVNLNLPQDFNLGELQIPYQTFSQNYLTYCASMTHGLSGQKATFLQKDLFNLHKQQIQLIFQKQLQEKNLRLAAQDYEMNRQLYQEKAETPAEFRAAETRYLASQSPLAQTEAAMLSVTSAYTAKQKDLFELQNQMNDEKLKFVQSLNSLISQAQEWREKYELKASENGRISYAGIIQENQLITLGQEVFSINPRRSAFFGEMPIPQDNMGKVRRGQQVLIKLRSYPYEEYGFIRGKIIQINDVPVNDSIFLSKVSFKLSGRTDLKRPILLKSGMQADAEIVTEEASVLQRLIRGILKNIK
ncbi:HlyD family secretion protein [Mucilaginibacter galii]|uniref:Hemolysin n=1 Tax=Mucilaginibacter galii TaxID=2005073 RepID=A0A917JBP6_9SPHI|nr:HlyD family efflux transporter periplasmic adaptor subunit [Mucilaginibacter galii]GGI52276.1 hemolysin [Mucilaginibacter galii]